jgi:acyl-coenzyme A synthetase/AMP-(fatty) acid ligase
MARGAERVPPIKLRAVDFVAEIPKSPAGKILRCVLKAQDEASRSAVPGG